MRANSATKLAVNRMGKAGDVEMRQQKFTKKRKIKKNWRKKITREIICAPTSEHEWLVRRGLGIDFHIGRRVRDGHLKGPGPNRT